MKDYVKYMFVGDTHGDLDFVEGCLRLATEADVHTLIQVGDWGFKWPGYDQVAYLDALLNKWSATMRFIDGNHDDHTWLRSFGPDPARVGENIVYQPRGSVFDDGQGTRMLFMGGAPSINRQYHQEQGTWWPEEEITEADVARALGHADVDVVVTHEAPDYPPKFGPKFVAGIPDWNHRQADSMGRVNSVMCHHMPLLLVHGHWHSRYTRHDTYCNTQIVGLGYNLSHSESDSVLLWRKGG